MQNSKVAIIVALISALGAIIAAFISADKARETSKLQNVIPVGTIIASSLTKKQFFEHHSKKYWALADGSSIGQNYKYFDITNNANVPDLRGVFLRGKDHGRRLTDDLPLGEYQDDIVDLDSINFKTTKYIKQNHNGKDTVPQQTRRAGYVKKDISEIDFKNIGITGFGHSSGKSKSTDLPKHNHIVEAYGDGDETRPKNVTVNYFIKIN